MFDRARSLCLRTILIRLSCMVLVLLLPLMTEHLYAQQDVHSANQIEIPTIEVIASTPLSSVGIDSSKYAGNVRSLLAEEIENSNANNFAELLIRNVSSISVNGSQGNPYQNDIFYRGFLASPLVGSAVGLSVYVDGVRVNEGFGDIVNWDLIPESAISVINVIPGSNPLFGLNTLGGALSLRTKSGHVFQGTEVEFSGGSWERWGTELEHGGYHGGYDWYLVATVEEEDGWRDHSLSEVGQLFAKVGWENEETDIDVSLIYNDNDLIGNGLAPERLVALDEAAVHTFPDNTVNQLYHFNVQGSHELSESWQVSFNAFHRDYRRTTLNGDAETECESNDAAVFTAFVDDDDNTPLAPSLCSGTVADVTMRLAQADLFDDQAMPLLGTQMLALEAGGEQRTSKTETDTFGTTLQSTFIGQVLGQNHQLTVGVDYSRIESRFLQTEAEAGLQRFGNSVGTVNPEPPEVDVNVETAQRNLGLYFTDTLDFNDHLALTLSGRWQDANIKIRDRTGEPSNADLNGDHHFDRFSPAVGISYQAPLDMIFFANYSEGFRIPTATELTCADPDDPCNLPNAFVADPPLDPVLAQTLELGIRGQSLIGDNLFWDAAIYRTDLRDDLLFTVTETGGGGFFQNIGETRRQGVELALRGDYGNAIYFANYSYVNATFETNEILASVVDADGIKVRSGDNIPGIPEHNLKIGVSYQLLPKLWVGGDLLSVAGNFLRGDEANQLPKTDGYTVLNLNTRAEIGEHVELWAKLDNVFDKEYETAGARNFNANAQQIFGDNVDIEEERFVAPGAPRAIWAGVKLNF